MVKFFLKILVFLAIAHHTSQCEVICTDNIFQQIYPNQNSCEFLKKIPNELKNLSNAIYPTNEQYNTVRFNFNKRFNVFPNAIITPKTPAEVAFILKILTKYNLDFAIRSGGHCYEPGSLSSDYIIDLRNFNAIKPDTQKEEVYIGAGCRLAAVIETLGKLDYCIPTGTCGSVGVTGLALGGGIGMTSRTFGLTCDSIKSITLVTHQGEIIEVNENSYPDLFWALRGGGHGSYGIVLGFTFKMYHVPIVSLFELEWDWDPTRVHEVVEAWESWVEDLSHAITTQLQFWYFDGKSHIVISGMKIGKEKFVEWEKAFGHLSPRIKVFQESYLDSAKRWTGASIMPFFKAKSKMIMEPFSEDAINSIIDFLEEVTKNEEKYYVYFEIGAFGGQILKTDNAFFPRDALAWMHYIIYWDRQEQEADALEYMRIFTRDISNYVSKYSYTNSVDYDLGNDYLDAYYGDHVDRLIEIKRKYDPSNVFHWKQSIPLSRPQKINLID